MRRTIALLRVWAGGIAVGLLLTSFAGAGPATQPRALEFPGGQREVVVPAQRAWDYLLVPVQINGRDAGLFMIDTGTDAVAVDKSVAKRLGLAKIGSGTATAIGEDTSVDLVAADSVAVGGVILRQTALSALDLQGINSQFGLNRIGGLLGRGFLSRAPFKFDSPGATLTLYRPDAFTPPADLRPVQLKELGGKNPAIEVTLEDDFRGWYGIDTGANDDIELQRGFAALYFDELEARPYYITRSIGVAGIHEAHSARFARVGILGQTRQDIPVEYLTSEGTGSTNRQEAGHIGIGMLRDCELIFDCAGGRIWARRHEPLIPGEWDRPGFDPKSRDLVGMTPLMRAAELGNLAYLKRFIASGADVNAVDSANGVAALHLAALEKHPECVEPLLKAGAKVEAKTRDEDMTPLIAAAWGSAESVRLLLDAGADINASDVFGRTPLIAAASRGQLEIVQLLLKRHAKMDVISPAEGTALHSAAFFNYPQVVRALLDAGAAPNVIAPKKDNSTPLMIAAYSGSSEIVKLLLDRGVSVDQASPRGVTALMVAASQGHLDVVKLLLSRGADPSHVDKNDHSVSDWAVGGGDADIVAAIHFSRVPATAPASGNKND